MGKNAWIRPGAYITINTAAWLEQRTRGPDENLTEDLHAWAARTSTQGRRRWREAAYAWCCTRGYDLNDSSRITHTGTRLEASIWILRATVGARYRIAVVGLNHDAPTVYADTCHDPWDWFDADSIDIICPSGHGWTWGTGRELRTRRGNRTTLTLVFGPDLGAPFTPCPRCSSHRVGTCGCDGAPWILCPICGRRCDVDLAAR